MGFTVGSVPGNQKNLFKLKTHTHFEYRAKAINPMKVIKIPAIPIEFGNSAPRKRTSPARAKITSLHWVASTAATFVGVSALPLACKNKEVAITPDNRATNAVFIHCPGKGGPGSVKK